MTVSRRAFLRLGGISGAAVLAQRLLHRLARPIHRQRLLDAVGAQVLPLMRRLPKPSR